MECLTVDVSQLSYTTVKFTFLVAGWELKISSRHMILNLKLLGQLIYSPFGNNNLVPFHLWCSKIVLKREKV